MNNLDDFFISRDVIGYLENFVELNQVDIPSYKKKLISFGNKQQMSYAQWWRLLEELEEKTSYTALGLEIGKHIRVEHVGVLGYLFRTARNIGEALSCFKRFQGLIYAGSVAHVETNGDGAISLVWNPDYGYSSQTSDELLLSAMVNIVNEIIHPKKLSLSFVNFTQRLTTERLEACKAFFNCTIRPEQEKLAIAFSASDFATPIPHSDRTLHEILGKQAQELLVKVPSSDTFIAELTDEIIRCLHEGICDASNVALKMNISERTLHRRLKAKDKVFREVLKDIRKSMAQNYLEEHKLTLVEIALLLGYSEQSSFTRAFSQWYGCSPLQYRKQHT